MSISRLTKIVKTGTITETKGVLQAVAQARVHILGGGAAPEKEMSLEEVTRTLTGIIAKAKRSAPEAVPDQSDQSEEQTA